MARIGVFGRRTEEQEPPTAVGSTSTDRTEIIDRDHDGVDDREERLVKSTEMKDADTNKDGVVDEKEASTGSRLAKVFTHADKNKDGTVDRNELMGEVTHGYYSDTATQPLVPNIIDEKF